MRGLAALYVMACHFLLRLAGENGWLALSLRFGREAGTVAHKTTRRRDLVYSP